MAANGHGDARPQVRLARVPPVVHDARRNAQRLSRTELAALVAAPVAEDALEDLEALVLSRMSMRTHDCAARQRQQLTDAALGRMVDDARVLAGHRVVQHRAGGEGRAEVGTREELCATHTTIVSGRRSDVGTCPDYGPNQSIWSTAGAISTATSLRTTGSDWSD